jgi:hypothetical protein
MTLLKIDALEDFMIHFGKGIYLPILFMTCMAASATAQKKQVVLKSIDPDAGPPGTKIVINGENFSADESNNRVFLGRVPLKILSVFPSYIQTVIPKNAKTGKVTVEVKKLGKATSPGVFTVTPPLTVKGLSHTYGPPGSQIKIAGTGFSKKAQKNTVLLGVMRCKVLSATPNELTVVIPGKAKPGQFPIKVELKGVGKVVHKKKFLVAYQPKISSFAPEEGVVGETVTIRGTHFGKDPSKVQVRMGKARCQVVSVNDKELQVRIPKKAPGASFQVAVNNIKSALSTKRFAIKQPKISSFAPEEGVAGETVTIKGTNFGKDPASVQVHMGKVRCQVVSVKDRALQVRIPKKAPGASFQVAVNEVKSAPSTKKFTIRQGLKPSNMAPTSVSPGGEVKIFGTGFKKRASDHTLKIGRVSTKAVKIDGGALVFRVPKNVAPGPNQVQLTVRKGGTISIPVPLVIKESASVTSFSPTSGGPNTRLTVYGTGFGTSPKDVRVFFGRAQARVESVKPNAITAIVPKGVTSSRLTVQTRTNGTAYSDKQFKVQSSVKISGFAPTSGRPSQQVRLYGQGFDPKPARNRVTMGNKNVRVLQASPTSILVQIPKNATTGTFTVKTGGGGAGESATPFTVVAPAPPPPKPKVAKFAITDFKPKKGTPGTYVTITGSGFTTTGMRAYVGRAPAGMRVYSANQAMIAVPNNAVTASIILMSAKGQSAQSRAKFQVESQVSITKFYPLTGRPGTKVTIYGVDFKPNRTQVYLGNRQLRVEPGMTPQMMAVIIPPGAQSGPFTVQVPGKPKARSVSAFRVAAAAKLVPKRKEEPKAESVLAKKPGEKSAVEQLMEEKPKEPPASKASKGGQPPPSIDALLGFESDGETIQITSLDPTSGAVGDTIMINGSGFGDKPDGVSAWLGSKKAKVVGVVPDMVMIEVPAGAKSGKVKLKIAGKPSLTSKQDFKVTK